jgi:hypothetical protein
MRSRAGRSTPQMNTSLGEPERLRKSNHNGFPAGISNWQVHTRLVWECGDLSPLLLKRLQ